MSGPAIFAIAAWCFFIGAAIGTKGRQFDWGCMEFVIGAGFGIAIGASICAAAP